MKKIVFGSNYNSGIPGWFGGDLCSCFILKQPLFHFQHLLLPNQNFATWSDNKDILLIYCFVQ